MKARRRAAAWVLLATVAAVALTTRLGLWQLDRAAQKRAFAASLEARRGAPLVFGASLARTEGEAAAQHYRRTRVAGVWLAGQTVYLDNRQMDGRTGFYVVTPLRLEGSGDAVLVQRGWVPRDQLDRTRLPALVTPSGRVQVEGVIAPPPARLYEFDSAASGPIRQNLDIAAFARETGLRLLPLSIRQADGPAGAAAPEAAPEEAVADRIAPQAPRGEGGLGVAAADRRSHVAASGVWAAAGAEAAWAGTPVLDSPPWMRSAPGGGGLLRHWPPPATDVSRHDGYAFQWFALAALTTGLYVWFQLIRPRLVRHA